MVTGSGPGAPTHCPKPVEFIGHIQDAIGERHEVWAPVETDPLALKGAARKSKKGLALAGREC